MSLLKEYGHGHGHGVPTTSLATPPVDYPLLEDHMLLCPFPAHLDTWLALANESGAQLKSLAAEM